MESAIRKESLLQTTAHTDLSANTQKEDSVYN